MSENEEYWRNSKLDYLDSVVDAIDDQNELIKLANLMNKIQIQAIFKDFEDPYSMFNFHREYTDYYWVRWKRAVKIAQPDILLS